MTVKCPTCKKEVAYGQADFPFCSERCRLLDIGRGADEEYRIPAASPPPEMAPNELPAPDSRQDDE